MQVISDPGKIDTNEWSDFVHNHPHGNIFQTPEMYEVYKKTENYEPLFLAIIDDNRKILAFLVAVIQREYSGIIGKLTARSIIFGGPLLINDNPVLLEFLLKGYIKRVKSFAIYSQFRNFWDWINFKKIFIVNGFKFKDHLNILIDLERSEEELWQDVHSKRRNEIRRASKEGTTFSVRENLEDFTDCYKILLSVYHRAKLPIPPIEFFNNIFFQCRNNFGIKIFYALNQNRIIGCMVALVYKDVIYDFYAGAYPQDNKKYPNDLIPWEVFKWGKKNGFTKFDFGGAGKPDVRYGVRDYKKKFGGEMVNYGRFEIIHKPTLFIVSKIAFKVWQYLRKIA